MGSASTIPLQGVQPTFSTPGQLAQQGLGLQNLALGNALQVQRIKEAALQAQQQEANVAANQQINQAFIANGGDYNKTRSAIIGQVPFQYVQKFDQDNLENVQAMQRKSLGEIAIGKAQNDQIVSLIDGISGLPDTDKPAFYQNQVLPKLQQMGVSTAGLPPTLPADGSANGLIQQYGVAHDYKGQLYSDEQKRQRAIQEKAAAARSEAQANSIQAKQAADDRQRELEQTVQSHRAIDAIPDPTQQQIAHAAWMDSLAPDIKPAFKGLETYSPTVAAAIQKIPLTSQQYQTGGTAAQREADMAQAANDRNQNQSDLLGARGQLLQSQIELNAVRADQLRNAPLKGPARQALVQTLAEKAIQNAAQGAGPDGLSFNNVIQSVRDPNNYVDADTNAPEMKDHQEEVVAQLQKWQASGMDIKQKAANLQHTADLSNAAATKAAPDPMTTMAWMKRKGGQWLDASGQPDYINKGAAAKQAIMAERAAANPKPSGQPIIQPKAAAPGATPPPTRTPAPGARPTPTPPPADIAAKVPEGKRVAAPDGSIWKKTNGKLELQPAAPPQQ
jgi:hypothetical protein